MQTVIGGSLGASSLAKAFSKLQKEGGERRLEVEEVDALTACVWLAALYAE